MKIKRLERMRDSQRAYHRQCKWAMEDGIYAPHSYEETPPDAWSWWDDVGFILGGRRVIVWWIHPRQSYADEIGERAWSEAGDPPREGGFFGDSTPNYKRVGRSRKKIISYTRQPAQGELRQYYDKLDAVTKRLQHDGIDFEVSPSWRRERLSWATGVALVAPLEVRNEAELKTVADLARRLLRGETTLDREFPDYCYGKEQWLAEQARG
ncbi:hypothetical protein [Paralcaligenes ureilyticus]|uniref:Uncharacterized protein n=1 Tax=Paralcaligenes ureilyticus TaxID=627131 RepID=A0A4R3MBZ9_9BURK|nr:hypothetical protein [Paralcaligenes ureilyticus]TCT11070.1 hypothetical protein EDC26_101298 [Paralcaligenes ureilyticus]